MSVYGYVHAHVSACEQHTHEQKLHTHTHTGDSHRHCHTHTHIHRNIYMCIHLLILSVDVNRRAAKRKKRQTDYTHSRAFWCINFQSHVTSQPAFFPPGPDPGGMLSRSLGMPSRKNGPPSIWDTHGISGNVFVNPDASSSAPYPQESNPWISNVSEHTSTHVMCESHTPAQDQRCQPGLLARNSVVPSEGRFTTSATFACWKIRFKTEVCTCSQFLTEALLWIKEVEMVESVDDLKSSCSVRGFKCRILKHSMRRLLQH